MTRVTDEQIADYQAFVRDLPDSFRGMGRFMLHDLASERARADALQRQLEAARKHSEPYSFPDSLDPYEVGYARGYNMARDRIRVAIDADGQDAQA